MDFNEHSLYYLLDKRRPMLQFFLLKYLKYEDIVKFSLVSKDADRLCDANKRHSNKSSVSFYKNFLSLFKFNKSDKKEI